VVTIQWVSVVDIASFVLFPELVKFGDVTVGVDRGVAENFRNLVYGVSAVGHVDGELIADLVMGRDQSGEGSTF
jgi:hypothetical protein